MSTFLSTATATTMDSKLEAQTVSPLLRLPFELRLIIYEYLLFPSTHPSTGSGTSVANLLPDFHTYYSVDTNDDPFTLSVRTIDPWLGSKGSGTWRLRNTYFVRTGPFLTTTTPTTYRVLLSPYTAHLRHTVPSLLALNRQIHAEACKVLYSTYMFSFHTSIEAAVPFLSDLTPLARSHIRHIGLTKKALPYTKEFDRAEWSSMCQYIVDHQPSPSSSSSHTTPTSTSATTSPPSPPPDVTTAAFPFTLRTLHLNIIAGKPAPSWSSIRAISASDFAILMRMRNEWGSAVLSDNGGGIDLEWAAQLMRIRGLQDVRITALAEHCAVSPPVSEKHAFWLAFSKSVHQGAFAEWVTNAMLAV